MFLTGVGLRRPSQTEVIIIIFIFLGIVFVTVLVLVRLHLPLLLHHTLVALGHVLWDLLRGTRLVHEISHSEHLDSIRVFIHLSNWWHHVAIGKYIDATGRSWSHRGRNNPVLRLLFWSPLEAVHGLGPHIVRILLVTESVWTRHSREGWHNRHVSLRGLVFVTTRWVFLDSFT